MGKGIAVARGHVLAKDKFANLRRYRINTGTGKTHGQRCDLANVAKFGGGKKQLQILRHLKKGAFIKIES